MAFDLGDVVPLTVSITDSSGVAANAGAVTLTIGLPDGTSTSPSPANPTTGRYQVDYTPTVAGRHSVRWVATSANASAYTDAFDVRDTTIPYIVSLADAKQQLNMTTTNDDEELRTFLEAASLVVARLRGEAVVRQTVVEEHNAHGRVALNCPPVVSLTSVARVDGTYSWTVGDLHVSPAGVVKPKLGLGLYGDIVFTYVAGYTVVPADIALAARIIVQHLWKTQRGGAGVVRPGTSEDNVMVAGYAIPNRAVELLGVGTAGIA